MLARLLVPAGRVRVDSGYARTGEPCDHAILHCDCAQQHHTAAEAGNRNSQPVENEQYRRHRPVDELAPLEVHLPSEFATMERVQLIPGKRSGNECRSPAHGV